MSDVDDLDVARIRALLGTRCYGRSLDVRAETGSTNDDARQALCEGAPDGHTVVADTQTAGRGARGRHWLSPRGSDLYLSIAARPGLPLAKLPPLTLAVGLAVAECVDSFSQGACVQVKWPNDVLLEGRKVAGVLVETAVVEGSAHPAAVIGIGLNVGRRSFPEGLELAATSLALAAGAAPPRDEVLASLLQRCETWVDRLVGGGAAAVVAEVNRRLALRGAEVSAEGIEGTVLGVAEDGRLRLQTAAGEQHISGGRLRRRV